MKKDKISLIKQMLETAERSLNSAYELLAEVDNQPAKKDLTAKTRELARQTSAMLTKDSGRVIEGTFDGQNMVGPNGQKYPVPANYASKSKLVEGDLLKLTIASDGSFVYKQIGPVDRVKVIGILRKESSGEYFVEVDGKKYRVLLASVTYFQGQVNEEVALVIPRDRKCAWGAIENVIKAADTSGPEPEPKEATESKKPVEEAHEGSEVEEVEEIETLDLRPKQDRNK